MVVFYHHGIIYIFMSREGFCECILAGLCSVFVGNGTLNKLAGVDFKQLSLLAKINENQSGEVSCCPHTFFPHRCRVTVLQR